MDLFENKIRDLIGKNCLREAIEILTDAFKSVISDNDISEVLIGLSSSLNRLERDMLNGTLSRQEFEVALNNLSSKTLMLIKRINYNQLKLGNLSGVYLDSFPESPEKQDEFYVEQYGNIIKGKVKRIKPITQFAQRIYLLSGFIEARTFVGHFYPADKIHVSKGAFVMRRRNRVGEDMLFKGYYLRFDDDADDKHKIEKIELSLSFVRKFNRQEIQEILNNI